MHHIDLPPFEWAETEAPRGILTAGNSDYFPGLLALARCCFEQRVDLAIADHGLTREEIERLLYEGAHSIVDNVTILKDTLPPGLLELAALNARHCSCPEAWAKPWVCSQSPFLNTLWIDADALPVRDTHTLFDLGNAQGFVTRNHWSEKNERTYQWPRRQLRRKYDWRRYYMACQINTGVFRYPRGAPWIAAWWDMCVEMLTRRIQSSTRDNTAIVLALSTTEVDMPELLWAEKYNYAANGLLSGQERRRKRYGRNIDLDEVRADHPEAAVVHWLGRPKFWEGTP